jgi:microcystin-dependent protein
MSQLNLRTILSGDNISAVVEKINYNFQQIVLNGGGPQGDRGYVGPPGIPGPEGPTGPVGPIGPTGTYVYTGITAPASIANLQPAPREGDIFMQADLVSSTITFWEYDGTDWAISSTLNTSDGVFALAPQSSGGDQSVTAVFPRINKASKLLILDNVAANVEDQILVTNGSDKNTSLWLDQSLVPWGSIFADTQNQIRLLNTDPEITGPSATDRLNEGGGVLFSLERTSLASNDQTLRITNGDFAPSANNKYFVLGLSDKGGIGGTVSIFTDKENRVAIYGSGDPNNVYNQNLTDSLSVFGTELIYGEEDAKIRIDADRSGPFLSRLLLSKGHVAGSLETEYEWRLGNQDDFSDHALRLLVTDAGNSANLIIAELSSIDDRGAYTPKMAIGGTIKPIAELEIGAHSTGRLGFGQISATASVNFAAGYQSYNAFRERGDSSSAVWSLRGNGVHNGGALEWASSDGQTWTFLLMPSTSGGNRTINGDSFLTSESSITFKRQTGSSAKIFIDSNAYSSLSGPTASNAPHLIIGGQTSSAPFNFGSVTRGIGLHGQNQSIEWLLSSQLSGSSNGFRIIGATGTAGATSLSILKTQYRSNVDSTWKNAVQIIQQDFSGSGTQSGNVVIGESEVSGNIGKAKFSVVGSSGPSGIITLQGGATVSGAPAIVDFMTSGGTSAFTLDNRGNIVSGIRFGNDKYDSSDAFTLDHYEEGTWTPTLRPEGSSIATWNNSPNGATYKILKSNYTRVGNRVHVDFSIMINGLTQTSGNFGATGSMYISGLPYKPDFERINASFGGTVSDPTRPIYPVVSIKSSNFSRSLTSDGQAGTILPWPGETSTIPTGWALCDGTSYSASQYPDLYNVIGVRYGGLLGTNFSVPDLRGYFIRGLDNGAGIDSGRILGSVQQDTLKSHIHTIGVKDTLGRAGGNQKAVNDVDLVDLGGSRRIQATTAEGGGETRPKNVAMNYIISLGRSSSSLGIASGDMAGGLVLKDNVYPRLYLYGYPPTTVQSLSQVNVSDFPVGATSYLYGSFEYFVSSVPDSPVISPSTYTLLVGATAFSINLNDIVQSAYPLTSVSVSGTPTWLTYSASPSPAGSLVFAPGQTTVPGPNSWTFNVTALNNSSTVPGTGSATINSIIVSAPVITGPTAINIITGTPTSTEYTSTGNPTSWTLYKYVGGSTAALPTGISLSAVGSTANVLTNTVYNLGSETYIISATNVAGTGSKIFTVGASSASSGLNYSSLNSWMTGISPFGYWQIDVYDAASNGNLVATASGSIVNSPTSGGFTVYTTLNSGTTYYAQASISLFSGLSSVYDPYASYISSASTMYIGYFSGGNTWLSWDGFVPSRMSFTYSTGMSLNIFTQGG